MRTSQEKILRILIGCDQWIVLDSGKSIWIAPKLSFGAYLFSKTILWRLSFFQNYPWLANLLQKLSQVSRPAFRQKPRLSSRESVIERIVARRPKLGEKEPLSPGQRTGQVRGEDRPHFPRQDGPRFRGYPQGVALTEGQRQTANLLGSAGLPDVFGQPFGLGLVS